MKAYSARTKTTYDSWDALVAAEADGYAVIIVGTVASGKVEFANIYGKRPTQAKARNLASTARKQAKRDGDPKYTYKFYVRPNWK